MNKININNLFKIFKKQWITILFIYHCFFIYLAYTFRINRGISDAHLYWAKTFDINKYSWLYFADYGTSFILFLNYPFLKLGLPFWFGFLLYGFIGFLAILIYIKWIHLVFGRQLRINGINILPIFYFLPNFQYWTSGLGKEPLIFLGLASFFYAIASGKCKSFSFCIGSLLVLIIRPHVAMMLLSSGVLVLFFNKNYSFKTRIIIASIGCIIVSILLYFVFQMTHIRYWNWERISYFNDYSIRSFRYSGSYVPMLDYNWFYKMFSFYFRPLFYDAHTLLAFLASIENFLILLMHLLAVFFIFLYYRKISFPQWVKWVFMFTIVCGLLYVQRYANLGIFMRTKMMFQPFTIIALLCIIKQGFEIHNSKIS